MKTNDWDIHPQNYLTDSEGNFVLKKDGTPKKKPGRQKNQSIKTKQISEKDAKTSAKRSVKNKEQSIKKLEQALYNKRKSLNKQKEILSELDGSSEKSSKVFTDSEINSLPDTLQEHIDRGNKVLFHPNEGPQTDFLAAGEKDVLYGGAAGGGKSYAMLVDPLRYAYKKAHRALIP